MALTGQREGGPTPALQGQDGAYPMTSRRGKTSPKTTSPTEGEVNRLGAELELLRGLVNMLPEGIVIHEPTGEIVYLNDATVKLCGGVEPATIAQLCAVLLGGEIAGPLQDLYARARNSTGVFLDDCITPSVHLTVSSRFIGAESDGLRLWSFTDHSPELRASESRHLEAVNLLATGIAHNFNNLLCGISGAIDVLETIAGDDTRAKRCVGLSRRCVDEGVALTRKMAGASPRRSEKELSAALEDVVKSVIEVQEVLQSGRVAFELAIPPDLPSVGMPWDALVRVVQNLVLNSVEAIEAVGTVKISAEVVTPANAVAIRIEDNGVGMDEGTLRKVFEPFFSTKSLDPSHGIATDGSGLGLWNVYRAVKTAGGNVSMRSEVGKGTTVEVTIPISHGG